MDLKIEFTEESKRRAKKIEDITGKSFIQVLAKAMGRVMQLLDREVGINLSGKVLNRRTGELARSMTTKVRAKGESLIVGRIGSNKIYAKILEEGGFINAKNKPFLHFKIGNKWIKTKQVYIPPRPYLRLAYLQNRSDVLRVFEFGILKGLKGALSSV